MSPRKRKPWDGDPELQSAIGRVGGIARAASMTPEERSALGKAAAEARWARWRRQRELEDLPPTVRPPRKEPSAEVLGHWLKRLDREQPEREWPNATARRAAAILLMKSEQSKIELDALRKRREGR